MPSKETNRPEWTVRKASSICRMDKGKFTALMEEQGLRPRVAGSSHLYDVEKLVAIVIDHKGALTSTDRRNMAQARKAETETAILERKYIKIEDIAKPLGHAISAMNKVISRLDISDEDKGNCIEQLQIVLEEFTEED
jgi:hypothetical protein